MPAQASPIPASSAAGARVVKRGGTFNGATTSDASTLHPYKVTDTAAAQYVDLMHGLPLADRDPATLDFRPYAASSWRVSEDRLTYTFTLRDDLKWSDGQPLTANDYAWTYAQAFNPENKYPYRGTYDSIVSYTAPDARTIVIKVKEPIVVGLERAIGAIVYPLPRRVWETLDWNDPTRNTEIMKPTIVAGPWRLGEWRKDDLITFLPNEHFFKGRANLDAYTIRIVPTPAIAFQMFKSGALDVIAPQPSDFKEASSLAIAERFQWDPAAPSWSYLGFNFRREHIKDPLVRRALSHAIDRQGIIDAVFEGLAKPTYSTFPPTHWTYNPDVAKYPYDLNRAKELLKQAGYAPGSDGIQQKDGKPLKLKLMFGPASSKVREGIATIAQQAFKDIGVGLEVIGLEFNAFTAALRNEQTEWDLNVLGWSGVLEPDSLRVAWMPTYIPELNAGAYRNPAVDKLFDEGIVEFDRAKRKAIYGEIQRTLSEDAGYIFLCYSLGYAFFNKRIGGVTVTPLGTTANDGLLGWYVR